MVATCSFKDPATRYIQAPRSWGHGEGCAGSRSISFYKILLRVLVDHLCKADDKSLDRKKKLSDDGAVFAFLKEHFLHWLESSSLIYKLSDAVLSIKKLLHKVQVRQIPLAI